MAMSTTSGSGSFATTIWTVIGVAVLLHGFLFIRYGSPHPCGAAAARVMEERPQDGLAFAMQLGLAMNLGGGSAKLIAQCYAIALLGPSDKLMLKKE
jgi:hypothetical protein